MLMKVDGRGRLSILMKRKEGKKRGKRKGRENSKEKQEDISLKEPGNSIRMEPETVFLLSYGDCSIFIFGMSLIFPT